jgi:hypothetical protein
MARGKLGWGGGEVSDPCLLGGAACWHEYIYKASPSHAIHQACVPLLPLGSSILAGLPILHAICSSPVHVTGANRPGCYAEQWTRFGGIACGQCSCAVVSARSVESELYGSYNSVATVKGNFKGNFKGITTSCTLNTLVRPVTTHCCYINVHATTSYSHVLVFQAYQRRIITCANQLSKVPPSLHSSSHINSLLALPFRGNGWWCTRLVFGEVPRFCNRTGSPSLSGARSKSISTMSRRVLARATNLPSRPGTKTGKALGAENRALVEFYRVSRMSGICIR